jgi:hypothetical protein
MVKIRDLGISYIPGTGYNLAKRSADDTKSCVTCTDGTTCDQPSCVDKDKDKDKDKKKKKKPAKKKYAGPFNDDAVAQLRQQLRHQLGNRI